MTLRLVFNDANHSPDHRQMLLKHPGLLSLIYFGANKKNQQEILANRSIGHDVLQLLFE